MEEIYTYIQKQPEFFAWVFAIVNILWGAFLYFNKIRHSKALEKLKQSLNLDLERRKKVFEMKASKYEAYFDNIDAYQRKHKNDYQEVFTPLFNEYMQRYLTAENEEDNDASTKAILWFSQEIQKISINGFEEKLALEHQTNSLKLTASDKVATLLEELSTLNNKMFEASSEQMNKLVEITINKDDQAANEIQEKLSLIGKNIVNKSNQLRDEMRRDLLEI